MIFDAQAAMVPPTGGGEAMLDFEMRRMKKLIDTGYRDAAAHDCTAAGGVLAGEDT